LFQIVEVIMLAYLFVLFAVAVRFVPHPWQFTPVAASLLFFGARGSRRQMWVPLVLFAVSDLLLNKFVYAYPFGWDQLVIWAWYAAILWLGTSLRERQKPVPVIGAALGSSISFFLISNFMVWAAGTMYPMTRAGLATCYEAAVPFFRHTLEGDLLFTILMFAAPVVLHALAQAFNREGDHSAAA
jgi:uncharacterized membrane protein (UPF0136 family)